MEPESNPIESLGKKAGEYLETRIELFKLKAADKSADIVSEMVSRLVLIVFLSLFLLIVNIGIALFIGQVVGKNYYGFFIVAGFYGLCGVLFYLFRNKWVKKPVSDGIIKKMTKDEYN
jgi:O-antigen ligase